MKIGAALVALAAAGVSTPAQASPLAVPAISAASAAGAYYPLTPTRIVDTRTHLGSTGKLGPASILAVQASGQAGVPASGVSAVVLNLTVTGGTASSFVAALPGDQTHATVSSINFPAGWTGANLVTVALPASGKVNIYNEKGSVDIVIDVVGFYAADDTVVPGSGLSGGYRAAAASRLYDSRAGDGVFVNGDYVTIPVDFGLDGNGVDINSHIRGLVVNITATGESATGFIRTWNGASAEPNTSTVNFSPYRTVANSTIVPTAACQICGGQPLPSFRAKVGTSGSTHVIVDLVGITFDGTYAPVWKFKPVTTPKRIVDTRSSLGTTTFGPGASHTVLAPASVAGVDTYALVTNVTAVQPSASTYFVLWPSDEVRSDVSTVNGAAGKITANAAIVSVGPGNFYNVYNQAGQANLLVDVAGTMEYTPPPAALPKAAAEASGSAGARTLLKPAESSTTRSH